MIDLTEFESRAVPLRALGVVVSQNGMQLARKLWDDACRRNVYSASKSFTSMAVGIAQKEGLLSIDEKLTDAFKDDLPEIVSDNLKAATVRDLLTMCLGQEKSFLMGGERPYYEDRNWVRLALRQPFVYAPGEKIRVQQRRPIPCRHSRAAPRGLRPCPLPDATHVRADGHSAAHMGK